MTYNQDSFADRRDHWRIELMMPTKAEVMVQQGQSFGLGKVLDISLGGAKVQSDAALGNLKGVVEIVIDGIAARAEIVWQSATEVGLRFVEQAGQAVVGIFESILMRENPTMARTAC